MKKQNFSIFKSVSGGNKSHFTIHFQVIYDSIIQSYTESKSRGHLSVRKDLMFPVS